MPKKRTRSAAGGVEANESPARRKRKTQGPSRGANESSETFEKEPPPSTSRVGNGKPEALNDINYFARVARVKSSNNRFRDLSVDVPHQAEVREDIGALPETNINAKNALNYDHKKQFSLWRLQLKAGFNLLFYGLGSKRKLVEDFCSTLDDGGVMVANGFLGGITAKKIIMGANKAILGSQAGNMRVLSCEEMIKSIRGSSQTLYIAIHNIDGPRMRCSEDQVALAHLAACPNIRILASMDHANAMMLWDMQTFSTFKWSMHDITTYAPYTAETWELPLLIAGRRQESERRGAAVVLKTLTQNAREVFLLIARYQLDEGDSGLPHNQLFRMCRERFLCSNEMTLKAHLTEFKDHRMVQLKKGGEGDCYEVALDKEEIETIVKQSEGGQD
ncbi:hypothetical protein BSKO_07177 [Bryopsis sp. KO-2023]|nr:hypothetical protein BSKO_07177 [Bryopsis sp. KO-2023]